MGHLVYVPAVQRLWWRRSTMRRPTGRVALRHGVGLRSLGGAWPRQNSRVRAPPPIPPRASGGAWRFPYPAPTKSCRRSGRDRPVSAECAAARNSGYSGVGPGVVGGCALYAVSTSSPRLGWPETPPIPGPRLPAMVAANLWRVGCPGLFLRGVPHRVTMERATARPLLEPKRWRSLLRTPRRREPGPPGRAHVTALTSDGAGRLERVPADL
jgi:hypothetical protein